MIQRRGGIEPGPSPRYQQIVLPTLKFNVSEVVPPAVRLGVIEVGVVALPETRERSKSQDRA